MGRKWLKAHEEQPYEAYDRSLLAEGIAQAKPKKPGKVRYSNFGMGLLGETLAVVTGQPYTELVTQHVLEPLGMANTGFTADPLQPRDRKGEPVPSWRFDALAGAGALRSNVTDMAAFVQWWMDPQPPFTRMLDEGLGWQQADGFIWHNGATYGSASFIAVDMENEVGVVMLSNVSDPLGLTITTTGFKAMAKLRSEE
jgi:CubicO group peptidase (beta-lactamase class C family)